MTAAATRTRPRVSDHLHVGMRVLRTDNCTVWCIQNLWRVDGEALLVEHGTGDRETVTFAVLFKQYAVIQPFAHNTR